MKNKKANGTLLLFVIFTSTILGSIFTLFSIKVDEFRIPTTEGYELYRNWVVPIYLTACLVVGGAVLGMKNLFQQSKQEGRWVINGTRFITVFLPCLVLVYVVNSKFLDWTFLNFRGLYNNDLELFMTIYTFSSYIGIFLGVYSGYIATSIFTKERR